MTDFRNTECGSEGRGTSGDGWIGRGESAQPSHGTTDNFYFRMGLVLELER